MLEFTEILNKCESESESDAETVLSFFESGNDSSFSRASDLANNILTEVMQFRRISGTHTDCKQTPCPRCWAPHLSKVLFSILQNQPITFVLPAFPGKSPNLAKVFGPLPDMAERKALEFLQHLCNRIQKIYSPGARIILCSDGRVFSDVVGMTDENVSAYQKEIAKIIVELNLSSLLTFNLEEKYEGLSFNQMRTKLMLQYGDSLDSLKASVSQGGKNPRCTVDEQEAHRLYCGITRFLLEDSMYPGQKQSRSSLQKNCRIRAYQVIQRSKAWGEFVEAHFPSAIRLSIHPQTCGANKLGIRLIEPDHWLTPWHAVAVEVGGSFVLYKRAQAEAAGAKLILREGRPSHYVLEGAFHEA